MPLNTRIITIFRLRHPDTREPSHISPTYQPFESMMKTSFPGRVFSTFMAGTATKSAQVYVDRVSSYSNYPQDTGTHYLWRLGASNFCQVLCCEIWQVAKKTEGFYCIAGGFLHLVSLNFPKFWEGFPEEHLYRLEPPQGFTVNFS